ncbi:hypothetical protein LWI29_012449 [Acer saccharum]|uniref:Uncharacterized protein n=1 Tax=Acer saccharum TaxID=4024 RepID=A0AA39SG15_ACESA|nr:hypothetical protein LWI29_012449 [Acer saccharum]
MVLGIGYCGLKGHIPVWLSSCKKLHVLDLSWNHLDGRIPPWIGSMVNLFYLDSSNNSLTGEIPTNLTELKSLISTNCCSSNLTSAAGIPLLVLYDNKYFLLFKDIVAVALFACSVSGLHYWFSCFFALVWTTSEDLNM